MGSRSKVQADWIGDSGTSIAHDRSNGGAFGGAIALVVRKLARLERQLSDEYGPFQLFGLFLREEASLGKWDLVVAARWLGKDGGDSLELLSERLIATVGKSGIMMISRIVPMLEKTPFLTAITKAIHVEHGLYEISDLTIADVPIKHGYIFTASSRRTSAPRPR